MGPQRHHSLSFMHQNHNLVDTLQLARTISKKQNYRSQRNKVRTLRDFLDPGALMDWIFVPVLAGVGLHASQNGVSHMASAVLRSQGPLKRSPGWP